mmetsp:Transcript_58012/g.111881  ORF Transcript_58012/g.111881 Transcript_58012/m.111881 type:complete len:1193 (+) Transcript_58012:138-3716(+)|eukprot:CAMPEP_0172685110 /NCGR_PEP_ID=MMETSP1074-20121228/20013_1 /TAXON_ID=2916 /ORGANISM="Ceratium fusus, Strain PA161109" /LENGTH=1192 /DNA_ID=CAMNT_0013504205 /DNA_START=137 /DNA_END=3715 /DNA_ORIENTATION=-
MAGKNPKDATADGNLLAKVGKTIQEFGADAMGATNADSPGITMRTLLNRYTQNSSVSETNEDGEHLLFPSRLGDERVGDLRGSTLSGDGDQRGAGGEPRRGGPAHANTDIPGGVTWLDQLLRQLDHGRLPLIKDRFLQRGGNLPSEDFAVLMAGQIGEVEGCDERLVISEFMRLHERLAIEGDFANSHSPRTRQETGQSFITEVAVDDDVDVAPEKLVSWNMFAKLLLDQGIVGDVVRNFNFVRVLSHIEFEKIEPLHDDFELLGNSLTLEQFLITMRAQFQYMFELTGLFDLLEEERQLVSQLVELYEMIDVSGSNSVSWAEFTTFLVDQGMNEDVPRKFNVISFSESPAHAVRDVTGHQSYCEKACYLRQCDKIAFVEHDSKCLRFCSPDLVPQEELSDFAQAPICAEYIEKLGYLVVSCSDLSLSVFDANNKLKLVRKINTKTAQLVLCWSEVAQVLFSADHEGRIFPWDMSQVRLATGRGYESREGHQDEQRRVEGARQPVGLRRPQRDEQGDSRKFLKAEIEAQERPMRHKETDAEYGSSDKNQCQVSREIRTQGGENIVTMLLELPLLARLASCGVDRNVMIWDVYTGRWMQTLKGHTMGVRCMAFAASIKVLVSGGYDYDLFVWNPYVKTSIHQIPGHQAPIVAIEVLGSSSNQVLSADTTGVMKTWDLASSSYQCLQTIVVGDGSALRGVLSVPMHKRIIVVGRSFVAYDYQNAGGSASQTDDQPIIKAVYHPRIRVFVTACATHLRIWDAVTGAMTRTICNRGSDITDFCLDDRGRKVFIADHSGRISVHSIATACLIKELTPHDGEVSGVIYCDGDRNVLTVSWDRSIVVHDESDKKLTMVWRKARNIHKDDISCAAFSRHLGLIATGSSDCVIALHEYERLRARSHLLGHKVEITAVAFIELYALLASADVSGNVAIWDVSARSGYSHKSVVEQVLTHFINMQSLERSPAVTCFCPIGEEDPNACRLYTGDEDGNVRAWDLSRLLMTANILPCEPKANWDPHKRAPAYDAGPTAEAMAQRTVALETPELQLRISTQIVQQALSWTAHTDSVRSLGMCKTPLCIITAGHDQMVKIWTREGDLMTVLRPHGQTAWHFPVQPDEITIDSKLIDKLQVVMRRQFFEEENRQTSLKHRNMENEVNTERPQERVKDLNHKRQVPSSKIAQKAKLGLHLQGGSPRGDV